MSSAPKFDEREREYFDTDRPAVTGVLRIARSLDVEAPLPAGPNDSASLALNEPSQALRDAASDIWPANDPLDADLPGEKSENPRSDGEPAFQTYREARKEAVAHFERVYIEALLDRCGGNVSQGARIAGVDRVYLHRLLRKHDLRSSKAHPHARETMKPPASAGAVERPASEDPEDNDD